MALAIPKFPNRSDPANPLAGVYGRIGSITLLPIAARGSLSLEIHPNAAALAGDPVGNVLVSLGQTLVQADPSASPPVAAVAMPTLATLMQDPEFAAAYATIEGKVYALLAAIHPLLAGATVVE